MSIATLTNREVVRAWKRGEAAKNHRYTLHTDGLKLYSYQLQIGDTTLDHLKVLRDYTAKSKWGFRSQTTSCHVGLARICADIVD